MRLPFTIRRKEIKYVPAKTKAIKRKMTGPHALRKLGNKKWTVILYYVILGRNRAKGNEGRPWSLKITQG